MRAGSSREFIRTYEMGERKEAEAQGRDPSPEIPVNLCELGLKETDVSPDGVVIDMTSTSPPIPRSLRPATRSGYSPMKLERLCGFRFCAPATARASIS